MGKPATSVESFWDRPLHELFELLPATPAGLTTEKQRHHGQRQSESFHASPSSMSSK
jgi:hypothetical protein